MSVQFVTPVNFQKQAATAEAIAHDVEYAWLIAGCYLAAISSGRQLVGARLLEIGPGPSFGTAVLLACVGARVTVADRYLAEWDDQYHVPFKPSVVSQKITVDVK